MSGSTATDDTWDLPAPVATPGDPYKVKPYQPQTDAVPYSPAQTAQLIGIWPPPGSKPGPMVAPGVQTSIRPDGTVAPYRPPTPLSQVQGSAAALGVPLAAGTPGGEVPATGTTPAGANQGKPSWEQASHLIQYGNGADDHGESQGQDIWNYRHKENPTYFTASGPWQMVDGTWKEGAQLAGFDASQWQHAIDAPRDLQERAAHAIYDKYGFTPWSRSAGGSVPDGTGSARALGVGPAYQEYLRQALAMNPEGYDPASIIPQLRDLTARQIAAEQPLIDARMKRQQQLEADADEKYKDFEKDLHDPALRPWTQKPPQPDPIGGLASLGSVFAAFASRFSHTPAVAMMNGMAAAIDARNAGNQKQYDEAFAAYKYNADLALKRNEIVQKAYDAAWARVKENPELGLAELRSVAQIYGDEKTELMTESGQLEEADKLHQSRIQNAQKLAEELAKLDATSAFGPMKGTPEEQTYRADVQKFMTAPYNMTPEQARDKALQIYHDNLLGKSVAGQKEQQNRAIADNAFKEMYGREPTDDDRKGAGYAQLAEQSRSDAAMGGAENVHKMAELVANYQMAPPSVARGIGASIMAEVAKIAPDYNARLYNAENKALGNFYGGQEGRSVRSINVAIAHLDTLSDLADALKGGDTKIIQRIANTVAAETGQPAPVEFNLAKQIVGDEINKAIVPGAGGQSERQSLAEQLNAANSPEQLAGAIKTAQQLLAGQTAGLKQQFTGSTGLSGTQFDALLMDRTKQVLGTDAADAGKARPTAPAAAPAATLPDTARQQLKKGVHTTFGNGQTWTLDDAGNPVQVPNG
jgi:hypothetical protein